MSSLLRVIRSLLRLNANDINTSQLEIVDFPETGRGLRAVEDIPARSTLLRIPVCIVTLQNAAPTKYVQRRMILSRDSLADTTLKESTEGLDLSDDSALAIYLLHCRVYTKCFLHPYVKMLPRTLVS